MTKLSIDAQSCATKSQRTNRLRKFLPLYLGGTRHRHWRWRWRLIFDFAGLGCILATMALITNVRTKPTAQDVQVLRELGFRASAQLNSVST